MINLWEDKTMEMLTLIISLSIVAEKVVNSAVVSNFVMNFPIIINLICIF